MHALTNLHTYADCSTQAHVADRCVLQIGTQRIIITAIVLKKERIGFTIQFSIQKDANGIATSEDPDQTAPYGAV